MIEPRAEPSREATAGDPSLSQRNVVALEVWTSDEPGSYDAQSIPEGYTCQVFRSRGPIAPRDHAGLRIAERTVDTPPG